MDPLAEKYPDQSPYCYCGNNPINNVDPDGQWFIIDDLVTGPVDEIVVLGVLAVGAVLGIEPAQKGLEWAVDKVSDIFSKDETKDETENEDPYSKPIEIAPEDRIPDDQLIPPDRRGNAPRDKKTNKPIEIHHRIKIPPDHLRR